MNAISKIDSAAIDWAGCVHWSNDLPYRMIVPCRLHAADGPMLYQVAGSANSACGAERALRIAMKVHGGCCAYCSAKFKANEADKNWTIDHVEPVALNGTNHLENLVIACSPCNRKKGHQPIDSFNPKAAEEWLIAVRAQIDARLQRLK
ncbi:MAG: HNH endonuclease [Sphingorhabdus sp.]